jgi:hypothetical protein
VTSNEHFFSQSWFSVALSRLLDKSSFWQLIRQPAFVELMPRDFPQWGETVYFEINSDGMDFLHGKMVVAKQGGDSWWWCTYLCSFDVVAIFNCC